MPERNLEGCVATASHRAAALFGARVRRVGGGTRNGSGGATTVPGSSPTRSATGMGTGGLNRLGKIHDAALVAWRAIHSSKVGRWTMIRVPIR
jgi:hypothetical protein